MKYLKGELIMEIIYFYQFNIKTQELKVTKCECEKYLKIIKDIICIL